MQKIRYLFKQPPYSKEMWSLFEQISAKILVVAYEILACVQ